MGAIGRGEDMEITTYLEQAMTSELQGNVADLCPVGALLPKPQNFRARPWEYNKTPGVDVMDALGSAIRIDTRGREVMRILPRLNEAVNEEWISDKTRQIVDGLEDAAPRPALCARERQLGPACWQEAFAAIAAKVKATAPEQDRRPSSAISSSVEEMFAAQVAGRQPRREEYRCRQDGAKLDPALRPRLLSVQCDDRRASTHADALLIIGSNPRWEAPVLNARIRRRWRAGDFPVGADRRTRRPDL